MRAQSLFLTLLHHCCRRNSTARRALTLATRTKTIDSNPLYCSCTLIWSMDVFVKTTTGSQTTSTAQTPLRGHERYDPGVGIHVSHCWSHHWSSWVSADAFRRSGLVHAHSPRSHTHRSTQASGATTKVVSTWRFTALSIRARPPHERVS